MVNRISLTDRVLAHLWDYGEITSWEAIKMFGATRLSAIIFNLRKRGWNIENEWEYTTNRYGDEVKFVKYKLIKENKNGKDIRFIEKKINIEQNEK